MTKYFNRLNLIFMGIMFIQIAFFFVVIFLIQMQSIPVNPGVPDIFNYVAIFLSIGALFGSHMVRKNLMDKAKQQVNTDLKKSNYQTAFIASLAILEAAALFNIIAYMLTQDKLVLGLILLLLIIQGSQKPGANKFMMDLEISRQEFDEMSTPAE